MELFGTEAGEKNVGDTVMPVSSNSKPPSRPQYHDAQTRLAGEDGDGVVRS